MAEYGRRPASCQLAAAPGICPFIKPTASWQLAGHLQEKKMKKQSADTSGKDSKPTRRDFVKTTAAAGAGLLIVPATTAFGSTANSSLGLGIIGCGGRGNYDGGEFLNNTDVRVTALADMFEDRVLSTRANFDKMSEEKGR